VTINNHEPMDRNFIYLLLLGLCGISCSGPEPAGAPEHPNILCLVCEDISSYLGCYGDRVALTPNLDSLAGEGIRFTRMYSVCGVCAPSRNALITGMYPSSIGGNNMRTGNTRTVKNVPDSLQVPPYECTPPPYVRCFTEYLRQAGYYCINNEKEDYQFRAPASAWDESGTRAHWRNRPEGKPFFAVFNFMRSHESQIWTWENEPWIIHPDSVEVPPIYPDTPLVRRDIARMYSNNTIMDREVGEMIDQLKEDGLLDQTIIIFYSDNGGPMPRGKREPGETGTLVPFIVRLPGAEEAGTVVDDLCSFVDIPATILSLAGVPVPEYMQGIPFLGEQKGFPRDYVFSARDRMDEWFDCRRAVRDRRYRYIRNYRPDLGAYMDLEFRKNMNTMQELLRMRDEGTLNRDQMYWFRTEKEAEELYDVELDPFELHNLAQDPDYREIRERLSRALDVWIRDIDDKGVRYATEKELMLSMWPGGIQPQTAIPEFTLKEGAVEISCPTPGASLVYRRGNDTGDGKHWELYIDPLALVPGDSLVVKAHRLGYGESAEAVFRMPDPGGNP
jgi:N-sulfoglucosamine sulfohydrolase